MNKNMFEEIQKDLSVSLSKFFLSVFLGYHNPVMQLANKEFLEQDVIKVESIDEENKNILDPWPVYAGQIILQHNKIYAVITNATDYSNKDSGGYLDEFHVVFQLDNNPIYYCVYDESDQNFDLYNLENNKLKKISLESKLLSVIGMFNLSNTMIGWSKINDRKKYESLLNSLKNAIE